MHRRLIAVVHNTVKMDSKNYERFIMQVTKSVLISV